jgi:hypothetical protein
MESFVARYPEIIKTAVTAATEAINVQMAIREAAAKKVLDLRAIDKTSVYACIGSDAGQAEIAYNIEDAALRAEFEKLGLIHKWSTPYLEYIRNHTDNYEFNRFGTFADVYTAVNRNHVDRLITGYRFDCKCHFFGNGNSNRPIDHHYINGEKTCQQGVAVHLSNIKTAINKIGFIGCHDPEYIYPIPNNFVD